MAGESIEGESPRGPHVEPPPDARLRDHPIVSIAWDTRRRLQALAMQLSAERIRFADDLDKHADELLGAIVDLYSESDERSPEEWVGAVTALNELAEFLLEKGNQLLLEARRPTEATIRAAEHLASIERRLATAVQRAARGARLTAWFTGFGLAVALASLVVSLFSPEEARRFLGLDRTGQTRALQTSTSVADSVATPDSLSRAN